MGYYVKEQKLGSLDRAGQLETQQRLPTPELLQKYVQPDYTIYNSRLQVAAYGDAKSGAISFDAQARGLVLWSTTASSRTLVYYVPRQIALPQGLLNFAKRNQVRVITVVVK